MNLLNSKSNKLFFVLGGFFICNALVAEFIGVKLFSLEDTLHIDKVNWKLFGKEGNLVFTAGVLLWPVVFVLTDVLNEYYGKRGVRFLSNLAVGLISYAFVMVYLAIQLSPADFWTTMYVNRGVTDMQDAYAAVFGQGLWIIIGSLVAFLVGQIVDVVVFHRIKRWTGEKAVYFRATGSTIVSQLIDSIVVLYIAFVLPGVWSLDQFFAVATVNYTYKVFMAIALTPVIYLLHIVIDKYLGESRARELKLEAMQ